ncbi:lantibiotic dehydratase [Lentzea sp. NPDC102401]|uniref:lantibiotic dehydratase n=1 Tax=Lentzea sp. NPDC102401 TaxID=3364128 RepID=UPI00380066AA
MNSFKQAAYRNSGVALLRAAVAPLSDLPDWWPDPADPQECRSWLLAVYEKPDLADAIRHASSSLSAHLETLRAGSTALPPKQLRSITLSVVRYLLRLVGRQTPFGLFAGVAPVAVGGAAVESCWGTEHRAFAHAEAMWLADVVSQLESCREVLARLDVVFSDLATPRAGRVEIRVGSNLVTVQDTRAVQAIRRAARTPVSVTGLVELFPQISTEIILDMIDSLVRQGFLITALRAPLTVVDPLSHVIDRLREAGVVEIPLASSILTQLELTKKDLDLHNATEIGRVEQLAVRSALVDRMRAVSRVGRSPLAIDVRLDVQMKLPERVARDVEHAATALARLSAQPTGEPAWRDYYLAFVERFGTGTLIPIADVVNPDSGLGFPHSYPGSVMSTPTSMPSDREQVLLALVWTAWTDGSDEVVLTEDTLDQLTVGDLTTPRRMPPHVEVAARVHAASAEALRRGDYSLTVAPARAAGTFTSRFTTIAEGSCLEQVYAAVPTTAAKALPVQLSFAPLYFTGENACRTPAYLPHLLSLGEHRVNLCTAAGGNGPEVLALDDIAVTASRDCLHLVSLSRQQVIEPQVFHALALDKQAPPLARFLAHVARGVGVAWHKFDWGRPAERLPVLPRVRYGRAVLSAARWRLDIADVPAGPRNERWTKELSQWRQRWRCPATVELRDDDRSLRLTLDEPAHAEILHDHVVKNGHAILGEVVAPDALGWAGGHVHEIAIPLASIRTPVSSPLVALSPVLRTSDHGQIPGSANSTWLYAKLFTHPSRMNEIITDRIPQLLSDIDSSLRWWFLRYRGLHENDHLRLRFETPDSGTRARTMAALGDWAERLRAENLVARLSIDTYVPEVGRYGQGGAMDAAENLFIADSAAVAAYLRLAAEFAMNPTVMAVVGMVDIVAGFLGDLGAAMDWLRACPAPAGTRPADGAALATATGLAARDASDRFRWTPQLIETWRDRAAALSAYKERLPAGTDLDAVLESLLHMHHNRVIGIDRDAENARRRMAWQVACAWHARQQATGA